MQSTKKVEKHIRFEEDAKSLRCKLELVNTYNLAGAAYWEKDRETDDIWDMVSEVLNVK